MAAELIRDRPYWYVPEHEKYVRTEFFSQPDFRSGQVQITRTQRFRWIGGHRGWAILEFDSGQRAFIHLRILNTMVWDPAASDPWYEFQRASIFPEEPEKIEARIKRGPAESATAASKAPIWKRYKDGWSINKDRSQSSNEGADTEEPAQRMPERKRSKYPLLPPIGAPAENSEQPARDEAR